ncbi:Protein FLX-like 1 [Linum grandiflorum]
MSGRNRGPPLPMRGLPPKDGPPQSISEHHFGRLPPHPSLLDDIRESQFGFDPRRLPPHPAVMEERLAAQFQDIQALLGDNQRLAATHVALKQELEATQHELQRMSRFADSLQPDKDIRMRDLREKSLKLESDLRGLETVRNELHRVRGDITELADAKQELTRRVQMMTQDLGRYTTDLKQVPSLKTDIETTKQELQRARAAIEYEKKGYAENFEHGKVMENKLVAMARELEKLHAEIANAEKRAHSAPNAGHQAYYANYSNPESGYAGNPYPAGYGMNPVQPNAQSYSQYGVGPASWGGSYDMRAQGR